LDLALIEAARRGAYHAINPELERQIQTRAALRSDALTKESVTGGDTNATAIGLDSVSWIPNQAAACECLLRGL